MKKKDVEIGAVYTKKVSGKVVPVRITGVSPYGGWTARNLDTGREIRVKSAAGLRARVGG